MPVVRMRDHISGGRHDGRDWPPANETIEVPDWEARDLIAGGLAVPGGGGAGDSAEPAPQAEVPAHPEPGVGTTAAAGTSQLPGSPPEPPPAPPEPLPEAPPVPEGEAIAAATGVPPGEAEERLHVTDPAAEETLAGPPAPHDVKQHWVDYAVTQGENPDTAAAMTKADLMSKYGGRL